MCTNSILLYSISKPFIDGKIKRLIFTMLMLCASLNYFTHEGGNLTESYTLTFQLIAFYLAVRYYQSEDVKHSPAFMFLHGLCVGVVLMLRANMIAMWGAATIVIGWRLLSHKEYKNFFANLSAGLTGVIVALVPPVVYLISTGSFSYMINDYILFNLSYSGSENFLQKLVSTYASVIGSIMLFFTIITILSMIIFICSSSKCSMKIMFVLAYTFSFLALLLSGRGYPHYFEILIPFLIPLMIFLVNNVQVQQIDFTRSAFHKVTGIFIMFIITIYGNFLTPVALFSGKVENLSRFYEELSSRYNENMTVLSTGNRAMFFNKLNIIPEKRYFYIPGISYSKYPFAIDMQAESILHNENDIIIVNYNIEIKNGSKLIFHSYYNYPHNDELMSHLTQNYELMFEDRERQLWIKKH